MTMLEKLNAIEAECRRIRRKENLCEFDDIANLAEAVAELVVIVKNSKTSGQLLKEIE